MSEFERDYMCQQFCDPENLPSRCLLQNTRQQLSEEGDFFGSPTARIKSVANQIADVCRVVAKELPLIDEFRTQ